MYSLPRPDGDRRRDLVVEGPLFEYALLRHYPEQQEVGLVIPVHPGYAITPTNSSTTEKSG